MNEDPAKGPAPPRSRQASGTKTSGSLPPAWIDFIRYCQEMRFGEIERLSIQDGLPVLAETTRRKVKFKS
ncbi:hypothetical protein [uncultured Paludibaculum sp.]|uniref:hypothetical protein n=1 Tax=uncultured Paludibaculum sp. TaxID=1765020 RepID=UPI002AAA8CA9|nr:hypothetical protein [uncultured Paludibaculum sp.]